LRKRYMRIAPVSTSWNQWGQTRLTSELNPENRWVWSSFVAGASRVRRQATHFLLYCTGFCRCSSSCLSAY
jgi:hypothetical protein